MEKRLKGIAASDGVAIGKAYVFEKIKIDINEEKISSDNIEIEKANITDAIESYRKDLENRITTTDAERQVADAHIELISDPALTDMTFEKISSELMNAELALHTSIEEMAMVFDMMDDEYLSERAADYRDIGEHLLYKIKGIVPKTLSSLDDDYIIISNELTPTDTSTMDKERVIGIATNFGGKTSHSSIIAQTLGIPAVVGMKTVTDEIKNGELIILDAMEGLIIKNPDEETIKKYEEKFETIKADKEISEQFREKEPITKDGKKLDVVCNIGGIEDLKIGLEQGAKGVGLFRTEFLYMEGKDFPEEERQFEVYKQAAELNGENILIIRTLDIGGDKGLDYFEFPQEENPFLGWRALRIQFDKVDLLRTQLRAILRASAYGNVKILLPMIISVNEIKTILKHLEEYKEELRLENIDFDENIEVGIMVETPASVFMAEELIEYADFFSIGTNDLTQYILAVDRGNERISHLYDYFNPAVLRAIRQVIEASHKHGKWTGMCGSMASDALATYLLLGLGLDEFSAVGTNIPKIKSILINSDSNEAEEFAQEVLSMEDVGEIRKVLKDKFEDIMNEIRG